MTILVIALAEGCGDDLGRPPYTWDASRGTPSPDSSLSTRDAQQDTSIDASETMVSDGGVDIGSEANPIDASVEGPFDADATIGANIDADAIFEAAADIPREASDPTDPLRAALRAKSPSCLACAQASCTSEIIGCSTIAGTPDAGRDAGATRAQLCVDTLVCVLGSKCDATDTSYCYCGDASAGICWVPDVAKGECKDKIERSFETTDPKRILDGLSSGDRDTGGGWAFLLARCLRDNACTSCFGRPEAGSDAPPVPDVTVDISSPPPPPPTDASVDVNPPRTADVAAEAEASAPPIDANADSAPKVDASEAGSPPSDADTDAETSTSAADFDIF